jgi:predicted permease
MLIGALAVAVITGFLFGLAPAILATEGGVGQALRQGALGTIGHRRSARLRSALVTLELALSVVLLVGAGLMVRSFLQLQRVEVGLDPRGLMSVDLSLPGERYPTAETRRAALDEVVRRVAALPGVRGADLAVGLPAAAGATFGTLEIEGMPASGDGDAASVFGYNAVRPSFFRLVALRLREGRLFSDDTASREAVINATMAARYWPGRSAVGRRFRLSDEAPWTTVAGVVDDVRLPGASGALADHQIYERFTTSLEEPGTGNRESGVAPQPNRVHATVILRVEESVTDVLQRLASSVASFEPGSTVSRLETMRRLIDAGYVRPRFVMALLATFALIAAVVASVGLYGVIAVAVSRRMREMGIRLALGAQPGSLMRLVLGEGVRLGVIGVVTGLAGAAALTRLMQGLIFGVSPLDPVTFAAVGAALLGVALLASYGPARRAVRADPLESIRSD